MSVSSPQRRSVELPEPPTTWPPVRETGRLPRRPRRSLPGFLRLGPGEREVLGVNLLTGFGFGPPGGAGGGLAPPAAAAREPASLLSPWQQWDWWFYLHIAQDGYFPGQAGPWTAGWDNREAFLPGLPLVLRAVHTVVPDWAAAGALISFLSGGVAVLALARIARHHLADLETGRRAVAFLLLSPCAVFLAAGYTEALFLALALPAWLAAQRQNWPAAAVLACLACSVRVTGLFLAAALALHFVLTARGRAAWRSAPWLLLPALAPVLYSWYLQTRTGDWMAWKHSQERGWYRDFHAPWEAWANTW
ncbi:mannosyltransferase family protein, partial [Streptomyces cadmiisoli]|uniref:mannosyltransferase family protein n=1 Tax=Streptomyces cadmiisoli TaxID=2184053 RepID=UPI003652D2F2